MRLDTETVWLGRQSGGRSGTGRPRRPLEQPLTTCFPALRLTPPEGIEHAPPSNVAITESVSAAFPQGG